MKKPIALLLAAVMLLSMTACGGDAKSAETAAPTAAATEVPTESVETEPANPYTAQSEIDIALQNAEAAVLSWPSNDTYTMVLRGLGYKEVDFTKALIMDERGYYDRNGNPTEHPVTQAEIHNIQFSDDIVRIEMSYFNFQTNKDEDNWVLYCTKSDSVADISGIDQSSYEIYAPMDWTDENADFYEQWDYYYEHFGKDCAYVIAYYYPESGNLYNFVRIFDAPNALPANVSSCLCKDKERANEFMMDTNVELTLINNYPIITSEFGISYDGQVEYYKYRVGMTLSNWAASELNTDGWVLGPDNRLFSPDRQYWLECSDFRLEQNSGRNFLTAIRSTAEHKNALAKSLEAGTAAAYLVDWQTALLPTNFAVVGNQTEEVTYGMYDMAYGLDGAETLNLYMRNVHPSVLEDVKVYAVKDNPEMQIPEDALVLSFVEAEVSEQDARFGQTMAVATCDMAAGANAFAITYQGKLVYWISLGQ